MSRKSRKRHLSHWYVRPPDAVLCGYEHYAGRWIADKVKWQSCASWRGSLYYMYVCESGVYLLTGPRAPEHLWELETS